MGPVHPRAGGEHGASPGAPLRVAGSSPRRRGTHGAGLAEMPELRFIPAQAGNTCPLAAGAAYQPVHPRAGGEHARRSCLACMPTGSSPRRRGTRGIRVEAPDRTRFIPAQAGNTHRRRSRGKQGPVHPRAGGEHRQPTVDGLAVAGSSPRRRGTPDRCDNGPFQSRFIPAQAGNTCRPTVTTRSSSVHPRAGGEHVVIQRVCAEGSGSSPRRRGTRSAARRASDCRRFIPAQAGNTLLATC